MSFMLLHHYLIEPTARLVALIQREVADAALASIFVDRLLVPKMHVAAHGADDANAMQIKLAYLSMLRADRLGDVLQQFERLLGSSTLSVELFDRWWTLSELETENFEELDKWVLDALPQILAPADPHVAKWLGEHAARRQL